MQKKQSTAAKKSVAPKKPAPKAKAAQNPAPKASTAKAGKPSIPKAQARDDKENKDMQRYEALKKQLLAKRDELLKESREEISKYIKGESRQIVETAMDEGDASVIDLNEDLNLRKLSLHQATLVKVDEALRKLADGTYGTCEDCDAPISAERLKVMPFAICCRDCQEAREEMESIEHSRELD